MQSRQARMAKLLAHRHVKGLGIGAALLVLVHLAGTLGYHYLGRPIASWVDSFYMTFITVATIGYGETIDLSHHPMGRLFTVFIAVLGIGAMSYVFSTVVALLVDADLNAQRRRRRMEKEIARLSGHYIVCGIGRVGSNVAKELVTTRRRFVVVESERPGLDAWLEHHPDCLYVHDDAADDDALLRAGLMGAAGVFAVTGDDSHNLMIAMSVKMLNPKVRVVVRLHDVRNTKKARHAGADEIVSPDFTGGTRIASAMVRPHVVNFMDQMLRSEGAMRIEELVLPGGMAPVALARLLPRSPVYMLMAAYQNEQWTFNPPDDFPVGAGVTLVLMANPDGRALAEEQIRKHS
ncbi:potassium channel family protein [Massilia sp. S19_KUP03_FR1]|uniref:potassium channel family protein n=1 Tax=Massilia sp. S19_KUP03_FR1 TaxID=3025503 RepID=UPI002FCD9AB4